MNGLKRMIPMVAVLLSAMGAVAQQSTTPPASGNPNPPARSATTVRGCLEGSRGNYVLVEDQTNLAYVLKGVGNKLDAQLQHEVEVKGQLLPGTIKTGLRPEKAGSNPSDTVHGVDGLPLQVADIKNDVRTISKHCKAADQQ